MKKILFEKNFKHLNFLPVVSIIDKNFDNESGFFKEASLQEKELFYISANKFSAFIKDLIFKSNSRVYIGKSFTNKVYYEWSDIYEFDAYNNLKSLIKKSNDYEIELSDDLLIIDYIVENNFRYFSQINFYLKDINLLIIPDCHIQLLLLFEDIKVKKLIEEVQTDYSNFEIINLQELAD